MDDVLPAGCQVCYLDTSSGDELMATVRKVHYDDIPPYYTIAIVGRTGERETVRSRLTPRAAVDNVRAEDADEVPTVTASKPSERPHGLQAMAALAGSTVSAGRLFKDIDEDGDGAVTRRELERYFTAHGKDPSVARALFASFDTDGDGLMEYSEFKALYQAALRSGGTALDSAARQQWRSLFAMAGGADPLFDAIDTNQDGCVTRRELAEYLERTCSEGGGTSMASRLVALVDGDKDGLIDRQELREAQRWIDSSDTCSSDSGAVPAVAVGMALPQHGSRHQGTSDTDRALGDAFNSIGASNGTV